VLGWCTGSTVSVTRAAAGARKEGRNLPQRDYFDNGLTWTSLRLLARPRRRPHQGYGSQDGPLAEAIRSRGWLASRAKSGVRGEAGGGESDCDILVHPVSVTVTVPAIHLRLLHASTVTGVQVEGVLSKSNPNCPKWVASCWAGIGD